jgi:hypothetical protein
MSANVLDLEDLELTTYCGCYGIKDCELCHGTKEIPTEFGEKVLAFVKKYLKEST